MWLLLLLLSLLLLLLLLLLKTAAAEATAAVAAPAAVFGWKCYPRREVRAALLVLAPAAHDVQRAQARAPAARPPCARHKRPARARRT